MKYKIVGIANIVTGVLFSFLQLSLLLFTYPKLFSLYEDFGSELPSSTRYTPLISSILIVIFLIQIFVGIRLLKKPTHKLFILGIICLAIILVFSGYFTGISVLSVVFPIYSLTGSL